MGRIIVFVLSALICLCPMFPGPGSNEGVRCLGGTGRAEVLLQSEGAPVCLSFENYKMKDGWTPVMLSMGELHCLLWMDASGRVSELQEPGAHFVGPVCFIDVTTKSLRREADALHFDVYEQNSVRTRWRLSRATGTVTKKILFREKRGIDLYLGTLRLPLKHVAWDFKEFSPGLYNVEFHGPMMKGHQPLVYEKAAGMIYSSHQWNKRLSPEQNRTRATIPGKQSTAAISPTERTALIALYNSSNGDHWRNNSGWKTSPLAGDGFALPGTENTWYGIGFDPGSTTVQWISLGSNNLEGPLPPELGNLANLYMLRLCYNQLSGNIPPELGNLANLQKLDLSDNWLNGSIPPELGNLANLQDLELYGNLLIGSIPRELGNLANLQRLYLYRNQLSGSIPPELGNLVNLDILWISGNHLSGSIPPELGNLANLRTLWLSENQLSGSIPTEFGNLANLIQLILGMNQFSGSIPPELGNLANLQWLYLYDNQLSGSIPPELGDLSHLQILHLSANQLSGSIPPELGNLANLQWLYLNANQLSGSIPPELGNLANLQKLDLSDNWLNGSIPPELGNLVNLQWLNLGSNRLSGSIPPELGNLGNLNMLGLQSNRLSGSIPSNLTNLTHLDNAIFLPNIDWNALYTNDELLREFLDSNFGYYWENTQTIAPSNVTATAVSLTSIDIHWTPIAYTSHAGGYRVFYGTTPGGPYTYFGMPADKTASSLTVTGLNPGVAYYFVVQTRTDPHEYNLNTVDSEYSAEVSASTLYPLILTSPNGGESWGLKTLQNITWTASGLSGNIKLELWKANKKLGDIAANIPIGNGIYAWSAGNYNLGFAKVGNGFRVKIITADGLYHDTGDGRFSIVKPSITLTSPQGGESWKLGTHQNITWTPVGLTGNVKLLLLKGGVPVGIIGRDIPVANGTYAWRVGRHSRGTAPTGSNYTVKICTEDNRLYTRSGAFTMW